MQDLMYHMRKRKRLLCLISQKWLTGVKSIAPSGVTDFVLAEGTRETGCLFGDFQW